MDRNIYIVKNYHNKKEAIFRTYYECIISNSIKKNQIWKPYLHDLFEKYVSNSSIVIENGCHIGAHTLKLAKLCRHIHAFEDTPLSVTILRENIIMNELTNVTLYRNQLSNVQQNSSYEESYREPIYHVTIDSFELENLDFLKLSKNVYKSIEGGMKTIQRCLPILFIQEDDSLENPIEDAIDYIHQKYHLLIDIGYQVEQIKESEFLFLPPQNDVREYVVM